MIVNGAEYHLNVMNGLMVPVRPETPIRDTGKRAGTSPVNVVVRETTMERQVHFQSSD